MTIGIGATNTTAVGAAATSCTVNITDGTAGRFILMVWNCRSGGVPSAMTIGGVSQPLNGLGRTMAMVNTNIYWFTAISPGGSYSVVLTHSAPGSGGAQLHVWELSGAMGAGYFFTSTDTAPYKGYKIKYPNSAVFMLCAGTGTFPGLLSPWVEFSSASTWNLMKGAYNLDLSASGTLATNGNTFDSCGVVVLPDDTTAKISNPVCFDGSNNYVYAGMGGINRALVLAVATNSGYATAVTWGGQSLTKYGSDGGFYNGVAVDRYVNYWFLPGSQFAALSFSVNAPTVSVSGHGAGSVYVGGGMVVNCPNPAAPLNDATDTGAPSAVWPQTLTGTFVGSHDSSDLVVAFVPTSGWVSSLDGIGTTTTAFFEGSTSLFDANGVGVFHVPANGTMSYTLQVNDPQPESANAAVAVILLSVGRSASRFVRYTGRRVRAVAT